MPEVVRIDEVESVPSDARVRHYDELRSEVKERFPELVEESPALFSFPADFLEGSRGQTYVKFTDYYRVRTY